MSSDSVKLRIQNAYEIAIKNTNTSYSRSSHIQHAFRDIKIFGADAGADFADTFLNTIVQEAVHAAECKGASMSFTLDGSGRAAVESVAQKLRELMDLPINVDRSTIKIYWAHTDPRLV